MKPTSLVQCAAFALLAACGTWVGNPKKPEEGGTPKKAVAMSSGDVVFQKVTLKAGQSFSSLFSFTPTAAGLLLADAANAIEMSVLGKNGIEFKYQRQTTSDSKIEYAPTVDGEYIVAIKNNSTASLDVDVSAIEGAESSADPQLANSTGTYKDYLLKAVVTFGRVCKRNSTDGNTVNYTAPAGEYYIQPFVFYGKVGSDKKVTPLSNAKITIVSGSKSLSLKTLSSLDLATYRETGSLTAAEHAAYTRTFYQGYLGAAGEMYTTDYFRFGGDCASAPTFALPTDVGTADITLNIEDSTATPPINETFKIRPTVSTAFSTYEKDGSRLQDYSQCTYNRLTGEPSVYNGNATECKKFSYANPPYVTLDYLMPSKMSNAATTAESDPTRILFYGHGYTSQWYKTIIENSSALRAGSKTSVTLSSCLNTGGLIAVPISSSKTHIPLLEMNVAKNDVLSVGRKTGSYTSLTQFYQGNIDNSGELTYPTCLPSGTETCADYKKIKVNIENCKIKSDSGISVTSISDSFIYPEYFEMSGVITE